MDTTFWRQVRTSEGKTKLVRAEEKKNPGRDFIFRVLLPGVFAVMVFYRIFVIQPESGEFYTKLAAKALTRIYQGKTNSSPVKHQSVSGTPQRSSVGQALQDSTV